MAIRREENGTYTVQIRIKDWTGKTVHKKKRGFIRKKDAKEWEIDIKKCGSEINMTMSEFVEIYYEDKKLELKERTLEHKKETVKKHILPYFGDRLICEITAPDIIQWQNCLSKMNYKPTYLHDINKHLNAIFSHASRVYNLIDNPTKRVKTMGCADGEKLNFWTINEYENFIKNIKEGSQYYLIFEILFWTGIRIGELLALTFKDIDLDNNQINISKTYYRRNKVDYITAPKTQQSNRVILIPEFLKMEISNYFKQIYSIDNDYRIFPIVAEAVQHKLKREIETNGLRKIRVHDLRHSHASYLINQGVDAILIKDRLGHKDIRITLNTYGHLYPSKQKELAEMLNRNKINIL